MDHNTLKGFFSGRILTKVVNTTKASPLKLLEVLVYSFLVHRANYDRGARQKQISSGTSLHESSAVPKALSALQRHGLVEKRGVYWRAVEPTPATLPWFKYRKDTEGQKWVRRFSYWWTAIRKPKAPLSVAQACLYFKLINLSDSGRRQTVRGLGALLSVDVKTIVSGVKKLKAMNLIEADLSPIGPAPDQVKWFRLRREKPPFIVSEHFPKSFSSTSDEAVLSKPLFDRGGKQLIDAGFSEREVIDYFDSVLRSGKQWPVVYAFVTKFEEFVTDIQNQHRKNVAAGKYTKAKNCRGLLVAESGKRLKALAHTHRQR